MKLIRKFHWFELTLIAIVMSVHLYAAFSESHNFPTNWFTRDDAYYYFKVAQNISEGHGSTFDGINLTNGYHPLWMLICIPIFSLARFDLILPLRILLIVMAMLSAATSVILFRFLRNYTGKVVAILAASFWAFSLDIHSIITQQGMETGIVAFSIVLLLYMLQKIETKPELETRDIIYLAISALFVLFSRLDNIYIVLLAGIWVIFRRSPVRYLLPLDLVLTFFIIVGAFIQRASLKVYLLAFDNSAITLAVIAFILQTIIFYLTGLYSRPASLSLLRLFILTLVGVTISTALMTLCMFGLSLIGTYNLPRLVPVIYWLEMLFFTLITRFTLHFLSPWSATLTKDSNLFQGLLAGKNQLRAALKPLNKWLKDGYIYFGIIGFFLGIYVLINQLGFGTLMPVSGQIKRWWGSMPNDVYGGAAKTVLDVFGIDPNYSQSWDIFFKPIIQLANFLSTKSWNFDGWYWFIISGLLISFFVLFLVNRKKHLHRLFVLGIIPLAVSAELHAFFYGAMAYSSKHEWYWVMEILTTTILAAFTLTLVRDLIPKKKFFRIIFRTMAGGICIYLAYIFSIELINRMPYQNSQVGQPYMDTLPILEGFTKPGAIIGMTGGGNAGYFIKDRTIVNMDGLINSFAYFQALKQNQGGIFLAKKGLNYVFANRYIITSSMPYRYQFTSDELITVDEAPAYGQKELMQYIPKK